MWWLQKHNLRSNLIHALPWQHAAAGCAEPKGVRQFIEFLQKTQDQ